MRPQRALTPIRTRFIRPHRRSTSRRQCRRFAPGRCGSVEEGGIYRELRRTVPLSKSNQ
jgi:hypothetical protein